MRHEQIIIMCMCSECAKIRGSIVVSISACHAEDPGSIPGRGGLFLLTLCGGWSQGRRQGLSPDSRQAAAFFCTRCLHDLRDLSCRWRPYRVECTGSLPTSEVKRRRARLVLGWGTAREDLRVLPAFQFSACLPWPLVCMLSSTGGWGTARGEWRRLAGCAKAHPMLLHCVACQKFVSADPVRRLITETSSGTVARQQTGARFLLHALLA